MPVEEAVAKIPNGASLLIGGFMAVGSPLRVIGGKQVVGLEGRPYMIEVAIRGVPG